MAIHFSRDRMAEVMDNYARWWSGELERPIMALTLGGAHPSPGKAKAPWLHQGTCADFRWSAEDIIDKMDEDLSTLEYAGDGYPRVNFDAFGPGICAAFCPKQVLEIRKEKVRIANADACIFCGQCELRCPDYAIYLVNVEE